WEFKTGKDKPPLVRQAIADSLEYFVQAPSLRLVLTPFDGVAGTGPIFVKLSEPGTSADISLFLSNNPVRQDQPLDMIPHFAAQYYLLPANARPKEPVPIPTLATDVPNCPLSGTTAGMVHPAEMVDVDLSDPNYCPMSRCFAASWPSKSCE